MASVELIQDIKDLMLVATNRAEAPIAAKFSEAGLSKSDIEASLREKLNSLYDPRNVYASPEGKNTCFALIAESVLEQLPKRVEQQFGIFIDQQTVKVGDKPRFTIKTGRSALKKYVTKGSQGGTYRKGTLDAKEITFDYYTMVGGVRLEYREYISGFLTMAELQEIILDQAAFTVFTDVQSLLQATYSSLPANNKHQASSLVEAEMDRVIATVGTYGVPVILCTKTFANTLPMVSTYDTKAINDIHNMGVIQDYKGTRIIILEQSFTDDTNTEYVVNDEYAYILPTGKEPLVKVVYEGQMLITENKLRGTGAMEFQFEQTVGMTTIFINNLGIYQNTAL
jgi:hypothetical protein